MRVFFAAPVAGPQASLRRTCAPRSPSAPATHASPTISNATAANGHRCRWRRPPRRGFQMSREGCMICIATPDALCTWTTRQREAVICKGPQTGDLKCADSYRRVPRVRTPKNAAVGNSRKLIRTGMTARMIPLRDIVARVPCQPRLIVRFPMSRWLCTLLRVCIRRTSPSRDFCFICFTPTTIKTASAAVVV